MRRIGFIRPNMFPGRASDAMTPLVFGLLAARTPADIETVLWDERVEPIPLDADVDLVAITVETYTARRAYQIAMRYRQRGIPVVMGGYHPTFEPDEALQFCDAVAIGDGEELWPRIVEDARSGNLQPVYRAAGMADLAGPSRPDRTIFKGKRYAPVDLVQFGRGCRFNCEFCSIRAFYGSATGYRDVTQVAAEISDLNRGHFFFVDDNLFNDRTALKSLLLEIADCGKTWSCQASIDLADDPELIELMVRSGCIAVLIGFESLDADNLKQMRKGWAIKKGTYAERIRTLRKAGLMIYGTFVFGYDKDRRDVFDQTAEFAIDNKFFLANFNPLTPMPGTSLYERLKAEGRLLNDRWWLDEGYRYGDATFLPQGMTANQLTEGCLRARKTFNTFGAIGRRLLDFRANAATPRRIGFYLLANIISRREIYAKQGRPLGEAGLCPKLEAVK